MCWFRIIIDKRLLIVLISIRNGERNVYKVVWILYFKILWNEKLLFELLVIFSIKLCLYFLVFFWNIVMIYWINKFIKEKIMFWFVIMKDRWVNDVKGYFFL